MFANTISFANLLLAALTAGAMFGLWLGMNPAGLPAALYVAQQQNAIRALNVAMPVLGGITALLTLGAAMIAHTDRTRFALLLAATACFLIAGVITRFVNQPINALVLTWPVDAPPQDWMQLRDQWWHWHVVRTVAGVGGLALLIAATVIAD